MKDRFLMTCVKVDDFMRTYRGSLVAVLGGVMVVAAAPDASAANDLGAMADGMTRQMTKVVGLVEIGCYATGLTMMGVGGMNAYKKSKGDPQVTTGSIFGGLLGGGAIAGAGLLVESMAASVMGGSGTGTSF